MEEKEECVVYLVVMVSVEGVLCWVFFDMGVGSLYVFVVFFVKFFRCIYVREVWYIEMMLGFMIWEVEFVIIIVWLIDGMEELKVDVMKVEKGEFFMVENFNY